MTIETITGIVGVKISMFDLLRLFLKYDPKGELITNVKKTCNTSEEKPLEEILVTIDPESNEWCDIGLDLTGRFAPYSLRIENSICEYSFELRVYRLTHDRTTTCDFILGEELITINTDNTHYGSLSRGDDVTDNGENKKRDLIQIMMISFMKSTVDNEQLMERKREMDEKFPELKEKVMGYHLVQNDCECCS